MNRESLRDAFNLVFWFVVIAIAIVMAGLILNAAFFEPKAQHAYQFEVADKLTSWCGASPDDPFNMQTLASLKANVEGEPERFNNLPESLQQSINAALRGDRSAACGTP